VSDLLPNERIGNAMTTTSVTSTTGRTQFWRRGWQPWAVGAGVLAVLAVLAAVLVMVFQMHSGVPAGLDYSTTRLSAAGLYRASFTASEAEIPVNRLHTWTLHVETPDGQPIHNAAIVVDGDMPQHGHGLPTRPRVTQALGNGDYLVEGMKFQMGGWWVIDFDITTGGQTDRVSFNLMLK
jgi:hypothetical protein